VLDAAGLRDPLNQVQLMDMHGYLENDILVKLDWASMMASLEGRVPLLNNDFVEYATRLHCVLGQPLLESACRPYKPHSLGVLEE
jgi:asparagine synthase (glutamine-hydrolysing)